MTGVVKTAAAAAAATTTTTPPTTTTHTHTHTHTLSLSLKNKNGFHTQSSQYIECIFQSLKRAYRVTSVSQVQPWSAATTPRHIIIIYQEGGRQVPMIDVSTKPVSVYA